MTDWLREFFRPSLKCDRTGEHVMREETRSFYRMPSKEHRSVVDRVKEGRSKCRRCTHATEWEEIDFTALQGITMSVSRMDELETEGRLYL